MEFDWDDGNESKSLYRHGIHDEEIEEALQDRFAIRIPAKQTRGERREAILGFASSSGRYLKIVYTRRTIAGIEMIRPIRAILMSRSQRARYRR